MFCFLLQLIVLIALSFHYVPTGRKRRLFELYSQRLIIPCLSLIKCEISNQVFPYTDDLSKNITFYLFKNQMTKSENKKRFILAWKVKLSCWSYFSSEKAVERWFWNVNHNVRTLKKSTLVDCQKLVFTLF